MKLIVADLDGGLDLTETEIGSLGGFGESQEAVLYVSVPAASRSRAVDNEISWLPAEALRNAMTVLRLHPWCGDALDEDDLQDIWGRVSRVPLYLLEYAPDGHTLRLRLLLGDPVAGLAEQALISHIRAEELRSVLLTSGALLPSYDRLHYEGPNGYHYTAFLRPGFALTSNDRLDRISFWLLPHITGRRTIVVDHWSMLALAHHAAAYADRALSDGGGSEGAGAGEDEPLFVEALRGYETFDDLSQRLRGALPSPSRNASMFLLSINSTGTLAHDVVVPGLIGAGQEDPCVVALATACVDDEREVPSLLRLDENFQRHPAASCTDCSGRKPVLPIDADTLLMKLAAYTDRVAITGPDAADSKELVEAYQNLGAFCLHRDHNDGGVPRHHAFYVDVLPMFGVERFLERLAGEVATLRDGFAPQVVVCPPSEAAQRLAGLVAEQLGVPTIVTDERSVSRLGDEQRSLLIDHDRILFVDDVTITGARILGFRHEINNLKRRASRESGFDMGCLVGVARPKNRRKLRGLRDYVHHRGNFPRFAAVEELFLPHWDQRRCPWCAELRDLDRDEVRALDLDVIDRRRAALEVTTGLSQPYFALTDDGASGSAPEVVADAEELHERWKRHSLEDEATHRYTDRYWELGPASVFAAVQGPDLMTAIAASVHEMRSGFDKDDRHEPMLDDPFRSPISKVLDPALYLTGRFYEPVILSCILRACNEWDLRTPDSDQDLRDGLESYLHATAGRGLLAEAIMNAAAGRLPVAPVLAFVSTFESGESRDQLQSFARALLTT